MQLLVSPALKIDLNDMTLHDASLQQVFLVAIEKKVRLATTPNTCKDFGHSVSLG